MAAGYWNTRDSRPGWKRKPNMFDAVSVTREQRSLVLVCVLEVCELSESQLHGFFNVNFSRHKESLQLERENCVFPQ